MSSWQPRTTLTHNHRINPWNTRKISTCPSCKNWNIRFTALRAKLSPSHALKLGSQRLNTELLNEEKLGRITLNTLKMWGVYTLRRQLKHHTNLHTLIYLTIRAKSKDSIFKPCWDTNLLITRTDCTWQWSDVEVSTLTKWAYHQEWGNLELYGSWCDII